MKEKRWIVYLVRCSDNTLYCGITTDMDSRLEKHNTGTGSKYTRSRRPVKLVVKSGTLSKSEASKLEYKIKKLPSHKKIDALSTYRSNK